MNKYQHEKLHWWIAMLEGMWRGINEELLDEVNRLHDREHCKNGRLIDVV